MTCWPSGTSKCCPRRSGSDCAGKYGGRRRSRREPRPGHLAVTRYHVAVLGRDLPGVHGDEICRRLTAERSQSRILTLTAARTVKEGVNGLVLAARLDWRQRAQRRGPLRNVHEGCVEIYLVQPAVRIGTGAIGVIGPGRVELVGLEGDLGVVAVVEEAVRVRGVGRALADPEAGGEAAPAVGGVGGPELGVGVGRPQP
jgi:hypothetical protein